MDNVKFILVSLISLALLGLVGYWAVITLEPGDIHVAKEKQKALETQNKELQNQVVKLQAELASLEASQTPPSTDTAGADITPDTSSSTKYQSLISDLQKLITDKVQMKVGSKGTRVGTVQTFLNIYNNTSKKVDNDYGASMKRDIANFEKTMGLAVDGEAGPATFQKMIEWLNSNT